MRKDFWTELSEAEINLSNIECSVYALVHNSHFDFFGTRKKLIKNFNNFEQIFLDIHECYGDKEFHKDLTKNTLEKLGFE